MSVPTAPPCPHPASVGEVCPTCTVDNFTFGRPDHPAGPAALDAARDYLAEALKIEGPQGHQRLAVEVLVGDLDALVARFWRKTGPTLQGIDVGAVPRRIAVVVGLLSADGYPPSDLVDRLTTRPVATNFDPKWRIVVGGPGSAPRASRTVKLYADDREVRRVRDVELIARLHDVVELRISLLPGHVEVVGDASLVALWRCDEHGEAFSASKPCPGCCPPDAFMVVRGAAFDVDYLVAVDVETYSTTWSSSETDALRLIDLDVALETARNVDGRVERAPNDVHEAVIASWADGGGLDDGDDDAIGCAALDAVEPESGG